MSHKNAAELLPDARTRAMPEGTFSSKMIFVGNGGVGKTSLAYRYVKNAFSDTYISTIGTNILRKEQELKEKTKVGWTIWDLGGQEAMKFIRNKFYHGTNAFFMVFDLTNPDTLEDLEGKWLPEMEVAGVKFSRVPGVVIGNKVDLVDQRKVTPAEIEAFCEKHGFAYIQTSAKTGENVAEAFEFLAYRHLENLGS